MQIDIDHHDGNWQWTLTDRAGRVVARSVPALSHHAAVSSANELLIDGVTSILDQRDTQPTPAEKRIEP
jgi:hypothetical protein